MIPDPLDSRTKRQKLLAHLPWFVRFVAKVPMVRKISILGSITTEKLKPKDIDFLVSVEDSAELEPVARIGRKLKGRATVMAHFGKKSWFAGGSGKSTRGVAAR